MGLMPLWLWIFGMSEWEIEYRGIINVLQRAAPAIILGIFMITKDKITEIFRIIDDFRQ